MKQVFSIVAMTAVALSMSQAIAEEVASEGVMMTAADGARIGAVYRVTTDGSAVVILNGKMVTVPASTLSRVDGKLMTSLKKNEILARK